MEAQYVFAVTFRLDPEGVRVDPRRFETRIERPAEPPGESGWLFFRDHLWRGEINDPDHVRSIVAEHLGVPVDAVEFRAFETDQEYLDALREAIAEDLDAFRADSTTEVIHKYLGSKLEVQRP